MPSFQINQDMTYAESPLVKNNVFLDFSVGYVPKATLARLIEENK